MPDREEVRHWAQELDKEADYNRDQAIHLAWDMTPAKATMIMAHITLAAYLRREAAVLRASTSRSPGE